MGGEGEAVGLPLPSALTLPIEEEEAPIELEAALEGVKLSRGVLEAVKILEGLVLCKEVVEREDAVEGVAAVEGVMGGEGEAVGLLLPSALTLPIEEEEAPIELEAALEGDEV